MQQSKKTWLPKRRAKQSPGDAVVADVEVAGVVSPTRYRGGRPIVIRHSQRTSPPKSGRGQPAGEGEGQAGVEMGGGGGGGERGGATAIGSKSQTAKDSKGRARSS